MVFGDSYAPAPMFERSLRGACYIPMCCRCDTKMHYPELPGDSSGKSHHFCGDCLTNIYNLDSFILLRPSMSVTPEQLDHLAMLCRIALSPEEKERLGKNLNETIAFVEQIQACDIEGVEPMAHPQEEMTLHPRQGTPLSSASLTEKFLQNVKHPLVNRQIEVKSTLA